MTRWTEAALAAVREGMDWERFRVAFPDFSYDAWEVKRRRAARDGQVDFPDPLELPAAPVGDYVGPTIVYWDLETTYSNQPRILSGAGVDGMGNLQVFDQRDHCQGEWLNDRAISVAIRDYLEQFSIIVGWNSKLFDVPVLNGRLRYWRERPLMAQMHVDLMYYASGQFMRIGRRSLANVSEFFSSPNRKTPLSVQLWDRADHGDMDAYDLIVEHNVADVRVTRDVWAHLAPFIRNMHRAG